MQRIIGAAIACATLALISGCDTPLGQGLGSMITINDVPANQYFKGVMAQMDAQQKASLQANSPATVQTLQHNDQLAQKQAAGTSSSAPSAQPTESPLPLKVEDIKAMAAAGIKPEAIVAAITESKTVYSAADLAALQNATPPMDPTVIECVKKTNQN